MNAEEVASSQMVLRISIVKVHEWCLICYVWLRGGGVGSPRLLVVRCGARQGSPPHQLQLVVARQRESRRLRDEGETCKCCPFFFFFGFNIVCVWKLGNGAVQTIFGDWCVGGRMVA